MTATPDPIYDQVKISTPCTCGLTIYHYAYKQTGAPVVPFDQLWLHEHNHSPHCPHFLDALLKEDQETLPGRQDLAHPFAPSTPSPATPGVCNE